MNSKMMNLEGFPVNFGQTERQPSGFGSRKAEQGRREYFQLFLVLAGFLTSYYLDDIFFAIDKDWSSWLPDSAYAWHISWFLIRLLPVVLVSWIISGRRFISFLGLTNDFFRGAGAACLFVLPLFAGLVVFSDLNQEVTFIKILTYCLQPGFYEEVLFRSFLLGYLFYRFRWGFIPAAFISSLFFGLWHLYQGTDWLGSLMAFGVTALGSLWFGWLYLEWRGNGWINIGLHILMNLSWLLFQVEGGAAGNLSANLFRAITVILSVWLTLRWFGQKQGLVVNRRTLWIHRPLVDTGQKVG